MKLLTWFFSVLILVVTCAPCTDAAAPAQSRTTSYQVSAPLQEHSAAKDACSPFCTCACCSIPGFVQNASVSIAAPEIPVACYLQTAYGKAISADMAVWQPPRLG